MDGICLRNIKRRIGLTYMIGWNMPWGIIMIKPGIGEIVVTHSTTYTCEHLQY